MQQKTKGLGPKSRQMLHAVGIADETQLRQHGAVAAYAKVKRSQVGASLNLLWALEGFLNDKDWREVSRTERTRLLLALDDLSSDDSFRVC